MGLFTRNKSTKKVASRQDSNNNSMGSRGQSQTMVRSGSRKNVELYTSDSSGLNRKTSRTGIPLEERLEHAVSEARKIQIENQNILATKDQLPKYVQESKKLDEEIEEVSSRFDVLQEEMRNLERDRRDINYQMHTDANAGLIYNVKREDEKYTRELKSLEAEFNSLARTTLVNQEMMRALKFQFEDNKMILPFAALKEVDQPYQPTHAPLPEIEIEDIFDKFPEYLKKPDESELQQQAIDASPVSKSPTAASKTSHQNPWRAAEKNAAPPVPGAKKESKWSVKTQGLIR